MADGLLLLTVSITFILQDFSTTQLLLSTPSHLPNLGEEAMPSLLGMIQLAMRYGQGA